MNPTMPLYNSDGSYYQPTSPTGARNPVADMKINTRGANRIYVMATAEAKAWILKTANHSLNTSLNYSLHYDDLKEGYHTPSNSSESYWNGYRGRARVEYRKWWQNQTEWLANYVFNYDDHNIRFVGGYSYREEHYESLGNENMDFSYDSYLWHNIGSGSFLSEGKANMWTGKSLAKLIGVFGRINYNWRDLIMLSASLRHEGSTKFGKDNKWGDFPSVSAAWEIANMSFMSNMTSINSLKPRVAYGVTGRSDFDTNRSMSTYSNDGEYLMDGSWVVGYSPALNANPNLGWEKLQSINVGIDFSFWNRLTGSIEWFNRQSSDLLYNYVAPQPPFIHSNILVNLGTTENKGIEVALDGSIIKKRDWGWNSGINYSYGTTTLTKLSDQIYNAAYVRLYRKPGIGTDEYFFYTFEGSKVGQFYGYEHAGISEDGYLLIYNDNGEKVTISEAKEEYKKNIGNGSPTSYLSWSNTFRYKNIDLTAFCHGAFDFEIFNMRRYGMGLIRSGADNVLRDAYTKYANLTQDGGGVITSYFLEKGDYFKIDNITLGYNVPLSSRRFIENFRITLTAKNIYTFTGYTGNDPSIVNVNGLTPSIDVNTAYPLATQFSLGVNLIFK
jgi:hypothetical protein